MPTKPVKQIEWMCTNCGTRQTKLKSMGRPSPGVCVKTKKPHKWVKNREL